MADGVAGGSALAERARAQPEATPGWSIVAPSSTVLRGRSAPRMGTINPRTTGAEIDATIARLTELATR